MAKRRSEEERAQMVEFIDWLYARSGTKSWADFATKAGVHWSNLSAWHRGKGVPDGYNFLKLLRAADALNEDAPGQREILTGEQIRRLTVETTVEVAMAIMVAVLRDAVPGPEAERFVASLAEHLPPEVGSVLPPVQPATPPMEPPSQRDERATRS
jgi:hypothetical protein